MEEPFEPDNHPSLRDLVLVVWRRKWLLPVCVFPILLPTLFYIWRVQRPVYESSARVFLDVRTRPAAVFGESRAVQDLDVQTEFEIMRAEGVLTRALQAIERAEASRSWLQTLGFSVKEGSRVMVVTGQGPTRESVRDMVNAAAEAYVEHRRRRRINEAAATLAWLRQQLREAKMRLLHAEEQFQRFKKDKSLPSLEEVRSADLQRYETLSNTFLQTQRLRLETESELAGATDWEQAPDGAGTEDILTAVAGATDAPSPALQDLVTLIQQKETALDAKTQVLKAGHPAVRALTRELDALRSRLRTVVAQMRARRVGSLQRRLDALRAQETEAQNALDAWRNKMLTVSDVAVEYAILEHQARMARRTYDLLDEKIRQLSIANDSSDDTARILQAAPPGVPVATRDGLKIALATLAGTVLFLALCFILQGLDTSLKSSEDVERLLGLSVVALIPTHRAGQRLRAIGRQPEAPAATPVTEEPDARDGRLLEAYRRLRTNLDLASTNGRGQCIAITSPGPAEEKSSVTVNLGIAAAGLGLKVVLVEGDLRRPRLHEAFSLPTTPGLAGLLAGGASEGITIHETDVPGLSILPSSSPVGNATELLHSAALAELVGKLRGSHDLILVNTPPVLPYADASVLAPLIDAYLLVVRAGRTRRPAVIDARRQIERSRGHIVGIVLNDVRPRDMKYRD